MIPTKKSHWFILDNRNLWRDNLFFIITYRHWYLTAYFGIQILKYTFSYIYLKIINLIIFPNQTKRIYNFIHVFVHIYIFAKRGVLVV